MVAEDVVVAQESLSNILAGVFIFRMDMLSIRVYIAGGRSFACLSHRVVYWVRRGIGVCVCVLICVTEYIPFVQERSLI